MRCLALLPCRHLHSRPFANATSISTSENFWDKQKSDNDARSESNGKPRIGRKKDSSRITAWKNIDALNFQHTPIPPTKQVSTAKLHHGLDRVLFNPGVHFLQDPRSSIYNFDPYLQRIAQPDDVDFSSFAPYITASRDQILTELANKHACRYVSSTSSISGALSQMYFLISGGKPLDTSRLSNDFSDSPSNFTKLTRSRTSIILKKRGDIYSIDADKSFDQRETILSRLGKSMERMLTCTRQDFQQHLLKTRALLSEDEKVSNPHEAYFYGKTGNLLLRAQLDCAHPALPRTTFDLKTRATLAIRMDADNYADNLRYHIKYQHGLFSSFEREYYDMIRSAFLKYSLQVRIGQMDGIFVAFHNTAQIFGFQYISLEEMDDSLFGSNEMGNQSFSLSVQLLQHILDHITAKHTHPCLRVTIDAEKSQTIYVEEVQGDPTDPAINKIDPNSPEYDPPTISKIHIMAESSVNGRELRQDEHPKIGAKDHWSVKYRLVHTDMSDHLVFDYFALRKEQGLKFGSDNMHSNLTKRLRKHFITEAEYDTLLRPSNKVLYKSLHPPTAPIGENGQVLDDGWQ